MLAGAVLVAGALVLAPTAWANPLPLTGEFLSSGTTAGAPTPNSLTTSATCSRTGPSTITYSATGTVPSGPYPGSFSETGVITLSNVPTGQFVNGIPFYQVSSVDAFFTITSAAGDVSGSKHLSGTEVLGGVCTTFNSELFGNTDDTVTGSFWEVSPGADGYGLAYDAIIETSGGTFEDVGRSGFLLGELRLTSQTPGASGVTVAPSDAFNEAFSSSSLTAVSVAGAATGGGSIDPKVVFGFEAKSQNGLQGQCDVIDQVAGVKVHCTNVTAFVERSATNVSFWGNATVNGTATWYEIDTQDAADPGSGADTFAIRTGAGYGASGTLTRGNVQIHD